MPTYLQEARKYVTSKFRNDGTFHIGDEAVDHARFTHFGKLYDYYTFNRDAIKDHIVSAMKGTFKGQTINKMQYPFYNLTKKVIDRLAVAYLAPAERYVIVPTAKLTEGTETIVVKDVQAEKDNALYQKVLHGSNINSACKDWNRLAKLLTTVYVEVAPRNGHIEYDVIPPQSLSIEESRTNYLEPSAVKYQRTFGGITHDVIWTSDRHEIQDEHGDMPPDLNPFRGKNPYGVIPMVPCRLSVPTDHWGEGDTELVCLNEKINIAIASMFYNLLLQSHAQAVAVNFNLPDEFAIGPDYTIEANDVQKDDVTPTFDYTHPNAATDNNIRAIEWMIKTAAVMKGISAQSMNTEISDRQSGVAKDIDLAELREHRRDDTEFLRPFEKRLFDITRIVWNTISKEKISKAAVFGIDFVEPEIPVSPMDDIIIKQKKMEMGLWSPVLDFIDEDEAIDENQALADVLKLIEFNRQIMKKSDGKV